MKDTLVQRLIPVTVGVAVLVAVALEAQGQGGTRITPCLQTVTTSAV